MLRRRAPRGWLLLAPVLLVAVCATLAVGPGQARADDADSLTLLRSAGKKAAEGQYAEAIVDLNQAAAKSPGSAEVYSLRGSVHFFQGKFAESVADFDRQVKLRPGDASGHWRRGISLYYAGEYEKGKQQFEGYEKVDTNDVENAIWHFMCAARKDGLEKARAGVLKIGKDRRPTLMETYDLFQGKLKPADVLASAEKGEMNDQQRKAARFYANLYVGIYHDLAGDRKQAAAALKEAATKYKIGHYMGEVARVHLQTLEKAK